METGADDYIIKPFNIEELHIRIRNLLEQREKLRKKFSSLVGFDFENVVINSLDESFLKKTAEVIERRMHEFEFDVGALKEELGVNRVHLYRKLKALTGLAPSTFIRNIRCKYAAKLMEQKYGNVTQIAYKVGFNNLSWFGKSFKEFYGISPSDYSRQFYN